jgi:hypothetical protein
MVFSSFRVICSMYYNVRAKEEAALNTLKLC